MQRPDLNPASSIELMKKNTKTEKVLDVAFELLKSAGDHGVTMRQVASTAGMSLSNVQYYYKTKDELLKALADRYFNTCLEELKSVKPVESRATLEEDLERLLVLFLQHGIEVTEMCCVFREYWAISTRNEEISNHIDQYYKEMVKILSDKLSPAAKSEEGLTKAVSFFIPYVEGYSITANAMPNNIQSITESLIVIISDLLNH